MRQNTIRTFLLPPSSCNNATKFRSMLSKIEKQRRVEETEKQQQFHWVRWVQKHRLRAAVMVENNQILPLVQRYRKTGEMWEESNGTKTSIQLSSKDIVIGCKAMNGQQLLKLVWWCRWQKNNKVSAVEFDVETGIKVAVKAKLHSRAATMVFSGWQNNSALLLSQNEE